jgi:uncharacterized protein YndB with AHSA1/START domain
MIRTPDARASQPTRRGQPMPSMVVSPIRLTVETAASPQLAWTYLTDPDRVAEWLTEASPIGAVGDPFRLDFGDGSVVEGRILALEPGCRFAHEWAWADAEPSLPTRVEWLLEPLDNGGSRLTLVHDGWTGADADAVVRDEHEGYWSGYLDDLRDILAEAATAGAGPDSAV